MKLKAEQAARGVEGRVDHAVELQIGLELALVEVELGLAPLLREIAPVPGREFEIAAFACRNRLQRLFVFPRAGDARRPDRLQQIERRLRRFRHRVGEAVMRVSLVAQQPRALGSQAHHFGGDGAIVGRAAIFSPRRPGAKRGLAKIAARGELQERLDARARQGDRVLARMAPVGGDARGARDEEIRQALEIGLIEQHEPVFFIRQHVLTEFRRQRRQPLGDCGQSRFGLGRRARAGAGEIEMIAVKHARLFGRKRELVLVAL